MMYCNYCCHYLTLLLQLSMMNWDIGNVVAGVLLLSLIFLTLTLYFPYLMLQMQPSIASRNSINRCRNISKLVRSVVALRLWSSSVSRRRLYNVIQFDWKNVGKTSVLLVQNKFVQVFIHSLMHACLHSLIHSLIMTLLLNM